MDKELQLEDFNLDLYDEGNGEDDGVEIGRASCRERV